MQFVTTAFFSPKILSGALLHNIAVIALSCMKFSMSTSFLCIPTSIFLKVAGKKVKLDSKIDAELARCCLHRFPQTMRVSKSTKTWRVETSFLLKAAHLTRLMLEKLRLVSYFLKTRFLSLPILLAVAFCLFANSLEK